MYTYGFSTAALYPRENEQCLKLIAGAGFDCAELMPQCFADASPEFASVAERTGLKVGSVHYPLAMFGMLYNSNPGMSLEARKFGRGLVTLCARLGASVLVVHPHEPPAPGAWKPKFESPILGNLADLAEECEKQGILLGMENNPKGPGRTARGLLDYIASLNGGKGIRPVVDTTESCESDQDPVEFLKIAKPSHLHLSDHLGEKKHIPAGEGEVDWHGVRDALRGFGYTGIYMLEPLYRYYLDDAEKALRKAREFIGGLIEG
jgi:sugar phosphate isomerase/epimerase